MNGRFLLDTSTIVGLLDGDVSIKNRLQRADEVFIASIVLGELYFGARRSLHVEEKTWNV